MEKGELGVRGECVVSVDQQKPVEGGKRGEDERIRDGRERRDESGRGGA